MGHPDLWRFFIHLVNFKFFPLIKRSSSFFGTMVSRTFHSLLFASLSITSSWGQETPLLEEESQIDPFAEYHWVTSGSGNLSNHATIKIPEGFRFLNGAETAQLMEQFGNLPDHYDGLIGTPDLDWFIIFQFEDSGYVKDDEKDDLDAGKLLKDLQATDEPANEQRKAAGLDTLTTVGWAVEPNYNASTNNLEWGIILRSSDGGETVNYLTKILGRRGIMHTTLLCDPDQLTSILPRYQEVLTGFEYTPGNTYAEYQDGDKLSEYGLKALIAGGGIFAAAKLGLFAKLALFFKKGIKIIVFGAVAIGVWLKCLITGKRADA